MFLLDSRTFAQQQQTQPFSTKQNFIFENDYLAYPSVPRGMLETIKTSTESSVMACAAVYSALLTSQKIKSTDILQQIPTLRALNELPLTQDMQNDFSSLFDNVLNYINKFIIFLNMSCLFFILSVIIVVLLRF